jgi:sporulation protein YlmC with PRC-barrel domain
MNKLLMSLLAAGAVAVTVPAIAQQPKGAAPAAAETKIPTGVFLAGKTSKQYLGRDSLIGAKVVNKEGLIIGDIEDLIINSDSNVIEGVIMGVGGFLGAGEKKVGVRYAALQITRKDGKTTIALPQATKEVLAALKTYDRVDARKGLVERAKEKGKELTDKIKGGDALDKAKAAGQATVDKTKELGGKAVEKGKELIDTAKEKAGGAPAQPKSN